MTRTERRHAIRGPAGPELTGLGTLFEGDTSEQSAAARTAGTVRKRLEHATGRWPRADARSRAPYRGPQGVKTIFSRRCHRPGSARMCPGMTSPDTSLVAVNFHNGARLTRLLAAHAGDLDWVGLSVDSADEATQAALGRGTGGHVARSLAHAREIRARGLRLKLNTVVTALNWREDMSEFVRQVQPERWKVFQVLPVGGQNDGAVDDLLIDRAQFRAFVDRHAALPANLAPIAEDNDAMTASYAMIDPLGRLFDNSAGHHTYSAPIHEVGVARALRQIRFSLTRLVARGGKYAW